MTAGGNMDNERHFIGQVLIEPDIAFKTTLTHKHFLSPICRAVFVSVRSLLQQGLEADLPTLLSQNKDIQASDLIDMHDKAVSSANWKLFERKLTESWKRREIRVICERVLSDTLTSSEMINEIMRAADLGGNDGYKIISHQDSLDMAVKEIEQAFLNRGEIIGIPSGIRSLDRKLNGFQKRRLYVIGGRPSQGKTALLVNFLHNANCRVGVMSAESSHQELSKRNISLAGKMNSEHLSHGNLGEQGFQRIHRICGDIYEQKIWYYDEPNMSLDALLLRAREMKQRFSVDIIYVDYLQHVQYAGRDKRNEQVGTVSSALKALSRNLDIPVVSAAQLRRPPDGSQKMPELHDLGDSGQIERDADCVILLHHGEVKVRDEFGKEQKQDGSFLLVRKNRDGATGSVRVKFMKEFYGFYEVEV